MKINLNKKDQFALELFLRQNSDRPIIEIYNEIKSKKLKERSKSEHLVFTYISLNKRKLGIKWLI